MVSFTPGSRSSRRVALLARPGPARDCVRGALLEVGADILRVKKVGRVNTYIVNDQAPVPNPRFAHLRLYDFLAAFKLREFRATLVESSTTA